MGVAPVTEGELPRGVRLLVRLKRGPLVPLKLCSPAEAPGLDTASAHTYSQHTHTVSTHVQSAHTYSQRTNTVSNLATPECVARTDARNAVVQRTAFPMYCQ